VGQLFGAVSTCSVMSSLCVYDEHRPMPLSPSLTLISAILYTWSERQPSRDSLPFVM